MKLSAGSYECPASGVSKLGRYLHMKLIVALPKTPDCWRDYLYWNQELENENER